MGFCVRLGARSLGTPARLLGILSSALGERACIGRPTAQIVEVAPFRIGVGSLQSLL